jgi:transposase
MKAMTKYRSHSVELKRQVAQEYLSGETLHGLAKRHDVSRNLIRVWVAKYEAGALDEDACAADLVYLAAILDAWSRRVVGYAIGRSIDHRLALAASRSPR